MQEAALDVRIDLSVTGLLDLTYHGVNRGFRDFVFSSSRIFVGSSFLLICYLT